MNGYKYWLTTKSIKPAQEKCGEVNLPACHDLKSVDWSIKLQLKQIVLCPQTGWAANSVDC